MKHALTHPRMLANLPDFYASKAAIQQSTASGTSFGTPVYTWATVSGLGLIDARVSPIRSFEQRMNQFTQLDVTHEIALRGYFPQIEATMRAYIDGDAWDIRGVEFDGNKVTTRLWANEVTLT